MAKAAKKPPTKSQILANIAEATDLSKKDVAAVFDALHDEIRKALKPKDGSFTIPGLVKVGKKRMKATPAQKNVRNPFTGELYDRPAKPAYTKITVRALKNLKDLA
jgi:nucleoid DNA-binding protein